MSRAAQKESNTGFQAPTDPVFGHAVPVNILKGGAGKSTISLNLADRLAAQDNDVLYMDLDPNGHVTEGLGYSDAYDDTSSEYALQEILINAEEHFEDAIYETEWGFDFTPSNERMEDLNTKLKNVQHGPKRLHNNFLTPLITNDIYDYVIMDGGGERSRIADNAFAAARQTIIPIEPGSECRSGFKRTLTRVVKEIRQYQPFRILAIVPNKISHRLDHESADRELIEHLNAEKRFADKIPNFARITPEEFEQIDNGEVDELPKPGIRKNADFSHAYENGMPLSAYNPDSETIEHLDELAEIVENGGVSR